MGGTADGRRLRHPARWLLGGLLVAAVGIGAAVAATRSQDEPQPTYCAGVGLVGAEAGSTAEEAFSTWLAENPSEPPLAEWHRGEDVVGANTGRRSVGYETTKSSRYWSVSVGTGTIGEEGPSDSDRWRVDGACVRTSD